MGRSSKKGPFVDPKLFRKVQRNADAGSKEPIQTWARACTIVPEFVGLSFLVHNVCSFLVCAYVSVVTCFAVVF